MYEDGDNGYKLTVMRFNSISADWELVGGSAISEGHGPYPSPAFAPDGTLYVAYLDATFKATVMRCSSTGDAPCNWVEMGNTGFSSYSAVFTSLAIAPEGTPYVAYVDLNAANRATVMRYNTSGDSWGAVGSVGFSAGGVPYISLAFAPDGTPYVAYEDMGNDKKTTVMRLQSATAPTATSNAATDITKTGATLGGTLNANNGITRATFEYGTTASYGSTAAAISSPVTGFSDTTVSASIASLTCGTLYHYRVKGLNVAGASYGGDQTFSTTNCDHTLTVTVTGNGTVTSSPQNNTAIACTSSGANCSTTFPHGTPILLTTTLTSVSLFDHWDGACSGTAPTCNLTLNGDQTVGATFTYLAPLKISGSATYFDTLQHALDAMADNSTITLLGRDVGLNSGFTLNRPVTITFKGGYDKGFSAPQGVTVIQGPLKVSSGTLRVQNVIVR
jgi:hypothetical protein